MIWVILFFHAFIYWKSLASEQYSLPIHLQDCKELCNETLIPSSKAHKTLAIGDKNQMTTKEQVLRDVVVALRLIINKRNVCLHWDTANVNTENIYFSSSTVTRKGYLNV